jgi:hypothetical protein
MAISTSTILKTYFNTGDQPTQTHFENLIDTIRKPVVDLDASTYAPTEAESGTLFTFDSTVCEVTLPTAAAGLEYRFVVDTTQGADASIKTAAGEYICGCLLTTTAAFNNTNLNANATVIDAIPATTNTLTFNGTTTGGRIGSYYHIIGMKPQYWHVSGVNIGLSPGLVTCASS